MSVRDSAPGSAATGYDKMAELFIAEVERIADARRPRRSNSTAFSGTSRDPGPGRGGLPSAQGPALPGARSGKRLGGPAR